MPTEESARRGVPTSYFGVHDMTPEMRMLYVSSSVRQAMMYEPNDIIGQSSISFATDMSGEKYKDLVNNQSSEDVVVFNAVVPGRDGVMRFLRAIHFHCDNIAMNLCIIYPQPVDLLGPEDLFLSTQPCNRYMGPGMGRSVVQYAGTPTKACLVLQGGLTVCDEDNPGGPTVLFASQSFSRILNVDTSDIQGLSFLALVAAEDVLGAAEFLSQMATPERIVSGNLRFHVNPTGTPRTSSDQDQPPQLLPIELLGAGSDDGAIILCQLRQLPHRHRRSSGWESDGYASLEDIISSDPDTSDFSDAWKEAEFSRTWFL